MNAELQEFLRQFDAIKADASDLTAGLTDEQFNWRPSPDRWSISECLGHLLLSGDSALVTTDQLIARTRAAKRFSAGPFRYGWLGNFIIGSLAPGKANVKTVPSLVPAPNQPLQSVLPAFLALQDQLKQRVEQADGLDLTAAKAPLAKVPIKLSLGQWFHFSLAHERRHLWQARNVKNSPNFPR